MKKRIVIYCDSFQIFAERGNFVGKGADKLRAKIESTEKDCGLERIIAGVSNVCNVYKPLTIINKLFKIYIREKVDIKLSILT